MGANIASSINFADYKTLMFWHSLHHITAPTAASAHKPIIVRRDGGHAFLVRVVAMTGEILDVMFRIIAQGSDELRPGLKVIRGIV
jgi:hypothetical protein